MSVLVAGAGGFIGGQCVRDLLVQGISVRTIDRKPVREWYYHSLLSENLVSEAKPDPADLSRVVRAYFGRAAFRTQLNRALARVLSPA
jgi:nucleoside-diphosphate-sugar epimerase